MVLGSSFSSAQERQVCKMKFRGAERTYGIYIPETAKPGAPLIVYTHGYGGSKSYSVSDLDQAAKRHGFAVCYPDGLPDTEGKCGWFVGYPSQTNMYKHEEKFFAALLKEVTKKFNLSKENVFLTGMSNGGDLCYHLIYVAPRLFKAYVSVAGLTFEYVYDNHKLSEPVALLEIHGNDDHTSMWYGDHENTGGWGSYIPVPLAVYAVAANNKCTTMETSTMTSKSDPDRIITKTVFSGAPSGKDVVLYEIDGAGHSWHDKDVDTGEILVEFFENTISK